jgi:protein gp37
MTSKELRNIINKEMKQHKISWLNIPGHIPQTWNPIIGCSHASTGCDHCYAEIMARRIAGMKSLQISDIPYNYREVMAWDGTTKFIESAIEKPFTWKNPRAIFVCSMSDLFHESTPIDWIAKVFATAFLNSRHLFIMLTKRPERAEYILKNEEFKFSFHKYCNSLHDDFVNQLEQELYFYDEVISEMPLKNVWLGVTTENQEQANMRIPILLQIPAKVRLVSVEPMLGMVDFRKVPGFNRVGLDLSGWWIIAGPETGPKSRPMQKEWIQSLHDQCQFAGVPFFDKKNILGLNRFEMPKLLN